MSLDAAPAAAPSAPAGNATITLDDGAGDADFIGKDAAPTAVAVPDTKAEPEAKPEPKPDADELTLELSRRSREVQAKSKSLDAQKKELEGFIGKHKALADVLALAKTDPLSFAEKLADAAGLDVDTVIEAYAVRKAGGKRDLSADERVARLERELQQSKQPQQPEAQPEQDEAPSPEATAALQTFTNGIKSLATAGAENFKLFTRPAAIEGNSLAAFDLMVLADKAGKPISEAAAVAEIERQLRADIEDSAVLLGYRRADSLPPPQQAAPATPTAPAPAALPRPTQASAAPPADDNRIRSDEEIAADWQSLFPGRR